MEQNTPDPSPSLEDVRDFYANAWGHFWQRLLVSSGIIGAFIAALALLFGEPLPQWVKWPLILTLSLFGTILLIVTFVRGFSQTLVKLRTATDIENRLERELKSTRKTIQSLQAEPKLHNDLWISARSLYGVCFNEVAASAIIDREGGCVVMYQLRIEAFQEGMDSLERWTRTTQGIGLAQEGDFLRIDSNEVTIGNGSKIRLDPEKVEKVGDTLYWNLKATPYFPIGVEVPFRYQVSAGPGSFTMTYPEMLSRNLRWEWFSHKISYPTKHLSLEVTLPSRFIPKRHDCDVWASERVLTKNIREYERVKHEDAGWQVKIVSDVMKLTLHVAFPLLGLTYALKWQPPDEWPPL